MWRNFLSSFFLLSAQCFPLMSHLHIFSSYSHYCLPLLFLFISNNSHHLVTLLFMLQSPLPSASTSLHFWPSSSCDAVPLKCIIISTFLFLLLSNLRSFINTFIFSSSFHFAVPSAAIFHPFLSVLTINFTCNTIIFYWQYHHLPLAIFARPSPASFVSSLFGPFG